MGIHNLPRQVSKTGQPAIPTTKMKISAYRKNQSANISVQIAKSLLKSRMQIPETVWRESHRGGG
jgi:hypothetical protein